MDHSRGVCGATMNLQGIVTTMTCTVNRFWRCDGNVSERGGTLALLHGVVTTTPVPQRTVNICGVVTTMPCSCALRRTDHTGLVSCWVNVGVLTLERVVLPSAPASRLKMSGSGEW